MFGLAFFNPYLLWGLGGAAIPILIHLFNRRRFRTVSWGAMEFLLSSSKMTAKRLKILQALLLLTRMGIVSLLVLGVARPYLTGVFFGGALTRSKSSAVIILDNSYSMGLREGNETTFGVAKSAAGKVVSTFRRGDSLTLLLMGARPTVVTTGNPSPERVRKLAENSDLSDERTDVLSSVSKGLEVLASEKNTRKELFLITDCQTNGWGMANRAGWERVNELLGSEEVQTKIYVVDVSRKAGENVTVSSIQLPDFPCGAGKRYMVEASARSSAEKPERRPIFTLFLDDEKKEAARAQGSEYKDGISTARLVFSVEEPGYHWGKIEVETDCLEKDNSRYFIVEARQSVPVLCVDGAGLAHAVESGMDYLRYAFAPEKGTGVDEVEDVSNVLDPKVVDVEGFWEENLGRYEIAALCNVETISARMYEQLRDFVGNGGGLMIFLGDKVDNAEYSERFSSSPRSFLPCEIGVARGEVPSEEGKETKENAHRISDVNPGNPAMAAFASGAGGDLSTAKFYRFYSVQPDTSDPDVEVLAKFEDGSPYVVEKRFGHGKTILFTTSCDLKWSNLPLKPVFLPLIHRLAYYLMSGAEERYNLTVGEKVSQRVKTEATSAPASVRDPTGATHKVVVRGGEPEKEDEANEPYVSFEETERAGIYVLTTREGAKAEGKPEPGERVRYFAVNVDTEESDLSTIGRESIERLIRWKELRYLKAGEGAVEEIEVSRHGREIWRFLVVGILCFLVAESVLARAIDKG